MTPTLVRAEHVQGYRIRVAFDDGREGVIDLEHELWGEVFEPLKNLEAFKQFRLDPELDTIVWPTGADIAPELLYERATGKRASQTEETGR